MYFTPTTTQLLTTQLLTTQLLTTLLLTTQLLTTLLLTTLLLTTLVLTTQLLTTQLLSYSYNHSATSAVHCAVALSKPGIPATVLSDTSQVFVSKNVWN